MSKFIGAIASRKNAVETGPMQAQRVFLRQRVKETGDDEGSGSEKTVNTEVDSADQQEIAALRKELAKLENEKATMELDFMNQMSQIIAKDCMEEVGQHHGEHELSIPVSTDSDQNTSKEIEQLRDDLKAADKELSVNRKDVESLYKKVEMLEGQKLTLMDELSELRHEVDNGSKVISSLNDAMRESDKHYRLMIEKLESELASKNNLMAKQSDELRTSKEEVERVAGQKSMLLEEITDLRMQLDRNDDLSRAMKKKLEELSVAQNDHEESLRIGILKQAAMDAEEKTERIQAKMESLENEMRFVSKSYKEDIARLEDVIAEKSTELDQAKNELHRKDLEITELKDKNIQKDSAFKGVQLSLEEKQRVIADLERKLSSEINNQADNAKKLIMSRRAEDDEIQDKLAELQRQKKTLEKKLAFEAAENVKMKAQLVEAKKSRPAPILTSTRDPPPPSEHHKPSFAHRRASFRNRSESPSFRKQTQLQSPPLSTLSDPPSTGSVKAIAARFETKKCLSEESSPLHAQSPIFSFPEPETEVAQAEDVRRHMNDLESQLEDSKSHNEFLKAKLQKQCEQIAELQAEVTSLNASIVSIKETSRKEAEQVRYVNLGKIKKLETDLVKTKEQVEVEAKLVEKLQSEIHKLTSERLAYEACTKDAFEKQKVKGIKSHQSELNNLKNDLTRAQMKIASMEKDHEKKVRELEDTIEELNLDCDKELEEKGGEVEMFKHMYEQQLDLVASLEKERLQLCEQMKAVSNSRREEIDELQSDLMDKSAVVTSLMRSLQTVEMQLEHQTDNSKELDYLRERVRDLEKHREPKGTALHLKTFEVEKLEEENRKLKEQVRAITLDRRGLQEKLKAVVEERNSVRSQPQVLRERNEKLKQEVARLYNKIEKLEGGVSRISI